MKEILISPSILSADFSNLSDAIKKIEEAGVTRVHLDVMDGHFVPNITFGPELVQSIRNKTKILFETHLMIEHPEKYIKRFRDAGSDLIIVHYETTKGRKLKECIKMIKDCGALVGISINPETRWEKIKNFLREIDLVLVMTVNPGFGGQAFKNEVLTKIKSLKEFVEKNKINLDIEVDGGINTDTARLAVNAGANILVAGASIFKTDNIIEAIKKLYSSIRT
jgi:ribulose-phosphate 3-epimerase